jgi:ubiquinone/menaquinone biosynthesis C-methylase UbiE
MCEARQAALSLLTNNAPDQGNRPPGTHRDMTKPETWIQRLERPNRIRGLRTDAVIACLNLKPGMVVADIGSGTGAFSIPFAKAVAPSGKVYSVDIWPELLRYLKAKADRENVCNLETVHAKLDDPKLPMHEVDLIFFHDVFHNTDDREAYLRRIAAYLRPGGGIAIVEQEFDDPIAKKWDVPEDRITKDQVAGWMAKTGFRLVSEFDIFQGKNNPEDAGMPERWFVVYAGDKQ